MENECPPARPLRFSDVEALRDRWDEGKASGCAGPLDIKRIIAEERALLGGGTKQRQQIDIERAETLRANKFPGGA
jgi:hypothetical protein